MTNIDLIIIKMSSNTHTDIFRNKAKDQDTAFQMIKQQFVQILFGPSLDYLLLNW